MKGLIHWKDGQLPETTPCYIIEKKSFELESGMVWEVYVVEWKGEGDKGKSRGWFNLDRIEVLE